MNMDKKKKNENSAEGLNDMNFERAFKRLEEIIQLLEDENTSLDESIELFKEGVRLYKYCKSKLESAKLVVRDVMKELEENLETEFENQSKDHDEDGESKDDTE